MQYLFTAFYQLFSNVFFGLLVDKAVVVVVVYDLTKKYVHALC